MTRILIKLFSLIFALLILADLAVAMQWTSPSPFGLLRMPQVFVRTETFPRPVGAGKIEAVIYGNSEIGFFSSKNFRETAQNVSLSLIPPSYLNPISFSVAYASKEEKALGTRKYTNPTGGYFNPLIKVQHPLSVPFTLINWNFFDETKQGWKVFPLVVNRLGEVVWIYDSPGYPYKKKLRNYAFDLLENGKLLLLKGYQDTQLEIVDPWGNVSKKIDFRETQIPYISTHTVQYLKDTNEILFLSADCRELPWYKEFLPLFKGPRGWLRLLQLPRRTYMGSKLVRMSLDTLQAHVIWDSYDSFSPEKDKSLAVAYLTGADRYLDIEDADHYLSIFEQTKKFSLNFNFSGWSNKICDVDWTHENSAFYKKGEGYLISVRNLNKVILVGENGKVKWTMGEGAGNDYVLPFDDRAFSMQHSASLIENGRVLLYDNHTVYRGFAGFGLKSRIMVLDPKTPGPLNPEWTFDLPGPLSEIRGTAMALPNHNFFAYTAGNPGNPSYLVEVNQITNQVEGKIQLDILGFAKGIEARPFFGFANDSYLGLGSRIVPREAGANPGSSQDPLEYSY